MNMLITKKNLAKLVAGLAKNKRAVIAPVSNGKTSSYQPVKSFGQICLDLPFPVKSSKEYFFADSEPILNYSVDGKGRTKLSEPPGPQETVLFGLRPCEAASYPIMDRVFSWDYNDEFYLKRRAKNTIITLTCDKCDRYCFCTSVGLTPQSTEGSDLMLRKTVRGNYLAEPLSPKGKKLLKEHKKLFTENPEKPLEFKGPEKKFDLNLIKPWLSKNFEHQLWAKGTLACIGCGACTYLCPTCHCFDIVDEGGSESGRRVKNWDSCQFAMFTAHASGHNPREIQAKRFRQRMEHKFNYYPDKFGRTLCVGCGRCVRHCPADMSLLDILIKINNLAKPV